jgi:hypothetical protein
MSGDTTTSRPVGKPLNHSAHFHGRLGAIYFITVCCQRSGVNQLCLHMLVGVPSDTKLSNLIRDFKRITTRMANIAWLRDFFDHRVRHDESLDEKGGIHPCESCSRWIDWAE